MSTENILWFSEIKEEEKNKLRAKEKAAHEHAAKLFSKSHSTVSAMSSHVPLEKSKIPENQNPPSSNNAYNSKDTLNSSSNPKASFKDSSQHEILTAIPVSSAQSNINSCANTFPMHEQEMLPLQTHDPSPKFSSHPVIPSVYSQMNPLPNPWMQPPFHIFHSYFAHFQSSDMSSRVMLNSPGMPMNHNHIWTNNTNSAPFTSYACNSVASSHPNASSASSHDSDFSASTFMWTSMAVLDGEAVHDADESGSDTGQDLQEQTAVPISIEHASNTSQCPGCVKKDREIDILKKK
ncbi:hypothetical protein DPMN_006317 [Dreissena polymorpha]|uniref:Uncharacterized protein n=1 Tax=Dreissena polymorpha TaxID=45954 RepID=A0A9D4MTT1_DREPO|nr:hypothetical protein DPMN_006317 [Dreissena polymorpha]